MYFKKSEILKYKARDVIKYDIKINTGSNGDSLTGNASLWWNDALLPGAIFRYVFPSAAVVKKRSVLRGSDGHTTSLMFYIDIQT